MINLKKGTAHSLQQSDIVGNAKAAEGVVAGMVVRLDTSNNVVKGPSDAAALNDLLGFALNSQTDGDVVNSGKLGYLKLDGQSTVEIDQACVTGTITAANFPVGNRISADPANLGKVRVWQTGDRVIGYVDGIRTLPSVESVSQNYVTVAGVTRTNTSNVQKFVAVLGIKLAV